MPLEPVPAAIRAAAVQAAINQPDSTYVAIAESFRAHGATTQRVREWVRQGAPEEFARRSARYQAERAAWAAKKQQVLAVANEPGATPASLARRFGLKPGTVLLWFRTSPELTQAWHQQLNERQAFTAEIRRWARAHPFATPEAIARRFGTHWRRVYDLIRDDHELAAERAAAVRDRDRLVMSLASDLRRSWQDVAHQTGLTVLETRLIVFQSDDRLFEQRREPWWLPPKAWQKLGSPDQMFLSGLSTEDVQQRTGLSPWSVRRAEARAAVAQAALKWGLGIGGFCRRLGVSPSYFASLAYYDRLPSVKVLRRIETLNNQDRLYAFAYEGFAIRFPDLGYLNRDDCDFDKNRQFADLLSHNRRYSGVSRSELARRMGTAPGGTLQSRLLEIESYENHTSQPTEEFLDRLLPLRLTFYLSPHYTDRVWTRYGRAVDRLDASAKATVRQPKLSDDDLTDLHSALSQLRYNSPDWREVWDRLTREYAGFIGFCLRKLHIQPGEWPDAHAIGWASLSHCILMHDRRRPATLLSLANRVITRDVRKWRAEQWYPDATPWVRRHVAAIQYAREQLAIELHSMPDEVSISDVAGFLGVSEATAARWQQFGSATGPDSVQDQGSSGEALADQRDQLARILAAAALPRAVVESVMLHHGMGLEVAEVARRTRRREDEVRADLDRGIAALREAAHRVPQG